MLCKSKNKDEADSRCTTKARTTTSCAFAGTRFTQIPACDSGPDGTHILGNVYEYAAADYVGIYPPQNNSLWFLRTLMAMALLTPVLWCAIKRVGIALTCAAYALWAWAYLYGTGYVLEFATALFPFSFGAYMSILGRNMINVFGRY